MRAFSRFTKASTAAVSLLALVAASPMAGAQSKKAKEPSRSPSMAMTMLDPVGSFAPMLERVIPAVVSVLVTGETSQPVALEPRDENGNARPLAKPVSEPFRAGGSGVVLDAARGLIITNNHVVENAKRIEVLLSDGRRMPAKLLGRDAGTDVAVIEVAERNLQSIPLGNSDRTRVGDVVLAVGNPFGLEGTATLGIVSALMRTEVGHGAFEDFMQIDAPINPGNSGGALVDVRGALIGINTAGPGETGRGMGIGFAIPLNMARTVANELATNGRMRRGSVGLTTEDLTYELMVSLKTPITRGARITEVVPGSPAATAGLVPGGIVIAVSGKPVRTAGELETRIATVPVGTRLIATVSTAGVARDYELIVTELPLKPDEVELPAELGSVAGAVIGDIRAGNPLFGSVRGAQVIRVPKGSPAWRAGLEPGDVITGVESWKVHATEDLLRLVQRTAMLYRIKVLRRDTPAWVRVTR